MVGFQWNNWVAGFGALLGDRRRKPRRLHNARIEALEDRALLTANLPVAVNDVYAVATDTTLNGTTVLANDTDADGDTISQAQLQSGVSHGTLTLAADGSFTYVPAAGFTGTDSFSYLAIDALNSETSLSAGLVTIHVGTTNSSPVATPLTINATTDTAFHGTLSGTDLNGDPLVFSAGATAATNGTVVVNPDGTFVFTPTAGFSGVGSFSFNVNDGTTTSADATVTVNVGAAGINLPPVAAPLTIVTPVSTTFNGDLSATDENGDALTFSAGTVAAAHGTVTINADGSFSYVPTAGFTGVDSFSFKASDGTLLSAETLVTAHVGIANALPVTSPVNLSTATNVALNGTLTATDANGDPLTFSAGSTAATNGSVVILPDGTFTFTPTAGFNGNATFSYRASDGIATGAESIVTVAVSAAGNLAPVGVAQTVSTNLNTTLNGTLTATDANGDTLTFAAGSVAAANGTVTINPDGTFSYVPNAGFTGVDSFSFQAGDGTLVSANTLVTVHVGITNSLPVVAPVTLTTNTDTALNGTLTATDTNGDPLTFSAGSTAATNGTVVINPDGTFTFTPTAGFTGAASFSYKASDGLGTSADATATVNVVAVNIAPIANPITVNTTTGVAVNGTLTATDVNGDPLTFSAGSTAATNGTVIINPDGTFTFTPTPGFVGVGTFSFKANDGTADSADVVGTVVISAAVNTAPVVINGTGVTTIGTALNASVSPLAVDAEGDPLTFSVVTAPAHGVLTLNGDGTFVFTPDAGFTGTDSFTFKANDGSLDSNVGTFNLTVNATADLFTLNLASTGTIATKIRSVVPLDANATLQNVVVGTSFANATIDASIVSGGDSRKDQLLVIKRGSSSVQVRGKRVLVNGTEVATVSGGRRGQTLHIAFNSNATVDSVNAVLQRVAARTRPRSSEGVRTVQLQVNADGSTSTATIDAIKA